MSRGFPPTGSPKTAGFSVVELALVVAASALVAAVSASAFHTYAGRREVTSVLAIAASLEHRVARAFETSGVPPADWLAAGYALDPSDLRDASLAAIEIIDGRIEVTFSQMAHGALRGRTLSLTPFETANMQIVWICGNRQPGVGLNPLGFAGGANQARQVPTTIETRYLPKSCY